MGILSRNSTFVYIGAGGNSEERLGQLVGRRPQQGTRHEGRTMPMLTRFWIIKCSMKGAGEGHGWHWDSYFEAEDYAPDQLQKDWAGPDWIKANRSRAHLRDDVQAGHLIVCYQSRRNPGRAVLCPG